MDNDVCPSGTDAAAPLPRLPASQLLRDACIEILQYFWNCILYQGVDEDFPALNIKFDNIRLRFVIWARATSDPAGRSALCTKNSDSVMETLVKLQSQLEFQRIYGQEFGMFHCDDDDVLSNYSTSMLGKAFRTYMVDFMGNGVKDLENKRLIPKAWIILESVEYLTYLQGLSALIDDLDILNRSEASLVIQKSFASLVMQSLGEDDLEMVKASSVAVQDIVANAALTQLKRLQAKNGKQRSSNESSESLAGPSNQQDDTWSDTDSSWEVLTPATSVAADLADRFAGLVEKSRETHGEILMQNYPIDRLAQRRILAEIRRFDSAPPFTSLSFINSSITNILGIIAGPSGSPYENGIFFLKFEIPQQYPLKAPKCRFITRIYHPNVDTNGKICMNVLGNDWRPVWSLWDLLIAIMSLLSSPNAKDALVQEIGREYINYRSQYVITAQDFTEKYAIGAWPDASELSVPIPDT
jgi:ubiquitin-protein ligase